MANQITAGFDPSLPIVRLSNGLMDVVNDVLALAGSGLAETDAEIATMVWWASHDQMARLPGMDGSGTAGFPDERGFVGESEDLERRCSVAMGSPSTRDGERGRARRRDRPPTEGCDGHGTAS
jgi:hypothetical protein